MPASPTADWTRTGQHASLPPRSASPAIKGRRDFGPGQVRRRLTQPRRLTDCPEQDDINKGGLRQSGVIDSSDFSPPSDKRNYLRRQNKCSAPDWRRTSSSRRRHMPASPTADWTHTWTGRWSTSNTSGSGKRRRRDLRSGQVSRGLTTAGCQTGRPEQDDISPEGTLAEPGEKESDVSSSWTKEMAGDDRQQDIG